MQRLINRLRINIQKEIMLHSLETIKEEYHKALKIEKYLKAPLICQVSTQSSDSRPLRSFPQPSLRDGNVSKVVSYLVSRDSIALIPIDVELELKKQE